MKKNLVRGSVLAVAALSLMIGGTSYTSDLKKQGGEAPTAINKAIENSAGAGKTLAKGALEEKTEADTQVETEAVAAVAEVTTEAPVAEEDQTSVEYKEACLASNQVVANIQSYLNIRAEGSEEAQVVGKFYNGNVGTIVEKGDSWSVVASGNAYGYVKNDYLLFGEDAEAYIENNCDQVAKVTADTLNVRSEMSTESDIVALSDEGDRLTVLDHSDGWFKVAVNANVVGYVSADYVYIDYAYDTAVTIEEEQAAIAAAEAEEAARQQAQQAQQKPAEKPASQPSAPPTTQAPTTEAPVQTPPPAATGSTGQDIANYAVQFVGNPYVYGGTSLTNGADCSGFVQSVYKQFGYSLSRTSYSQPNDGTAVSVSEIQPGDLLFYRDFGHVGIYIGGGQIVHASNKATGIKISNYDYSPINKAVRIVY